MEEVKEIYDLSARYDARASFYGKARVKIYEDGTEELESYSTTVARKDKAGKIEVFGWFSQTTGRHINEYLKQNGLKPMTKKEMQGE